MFVKVCGLKTTQDIDNAISLGFSAFGVVLTKKSKRFVDVEKAELLAKYGKGKIKTVAVAYSIDEVNGVYHLFDYVQLYHPVKLENLIFSSDKVNYSSVNCKYFLYDKSHGKGKFSDFPSELSKLREKLIIAGGLTCENVGKVVDLIKPFGVDVSSGVEKNGEKNFKLMEKFINEVKNGK